MKAWLYFVFVQIVALLCSVIGWVLLILPSVFRRWDPITQIYIPDWQHEQNIPAKTINKWRAGWLNKIWGNDEDGVTGPSWYNDSSAPSAALAYLWSAWRNSANNLRFVFRNVGGPFYRKEIGGWYFQAGYYANGFPVLSAGKVSV